MFALNSCSSIVPSSRARHRFFGGISEHHARMHVSTREHTTLGGSGLFGRRPDKARSSPRVRPTRCANDEKSWSSSSANSRISYSYNVLGFGMSCSPVKKKGLTCTLYNKVHYRRERMRINIPLFRKALLHREEQWLAVCGLF